MLRFLSVIQTVNTNLEFRKIHFNKIYFDTRTMEIIRATTLPQHCHTASNLQTWPSEHRMRLRHTSPTVLLPGNNFVALISWHDNHTTISLCCQPISEPHAVSYLAQKAQLSGFFLLVLD
jgi:hypothetical protein